MSAAPRRPLPLVTQDNEFFWASGADGTLRLQACNSCASLIHPPAPVCRCLLYTS
ncbi:zinc ribbon domain-containing protein, partial [Mycobacterium sp. UM_11]|uniref:zinc ribbon domain-containing protein n=1 Tax=Mycobacterium sp. UM_11 TaxID=1638773 RepID=UPI0012E288BC